MKHETEKATDIYHKSVKTQMSKLMRTSGNLARDPPRPPPRIPLGRVLEKLGAFKFEN